MASLTGQTVSSTYPTLLKLDNVPLTSVYKVVETGNGDDSALQLSTLGIKSSGVLETTGNATVGGTLAVTGATTLAAATVGGAAVCSTTLGVTGAATLGSTLGVTGATTLSSTANIVGAATCQSTLSAVGTISALGNMTVAGTATVTGGVIGTVTGNVTGNTAGVHTGNVTGNVTGNATGSSGSCTGNATTATTLATARNIALTGSVTGNANFDGSANISITTSGGGTITSVSDQANSSTGYLDLPVGTTAQRPATPDSGNSRYNTTLAALEYYTGSAWESSATAASTLTQFNASGSAPVFACRAWVNFNGTGTVAIRASGNVSSITDNGVGDYTVNFTTAMADVNYTMNGNCQTVATDGRVIGLHASVAPTVSACRIQADKSAGGLLDSAYVLTNFHR